MNMILTGSRANPESFGKVAVLMGGWSAEREVSLASGNAVLAGLKTAGVDAHAVDATPAVVKQLDEGHFDRAFIILHGRGGEDGTVQAALELAGIPYTGSGVAASSLCMDKWRCKLIASAIGQPTPPAERVASRTALDGVVDRIGLPLLLKPIHEGSSIGITIVRDRTELDEAWQHASQHDAVMAEAFVEGTEVTVAIVAGEALPLIAIRAASGFYDYEAKYELDNTSYDCPPTDIPDETQQQIQVQALAMFDALGCGGWGRVDFMLDGEGRAQFIECNTAPGMTSHSLVPMAARVAGIEFADLLVAILDDCRGTKKVSS